VLRAFGEWVLNNWTPVTKIVLFLIGLGLFVWEAAIRVGETRIEFLVMYGGMMGLPAFFPRDLPTPTQRPVEQSESKEHS
jgi:hypothetical protein